MAAKTALVCLLAICSLSAAAAETLLIPNGAPLPVLESLTGNVTLSATAVVLQGPAAELGNGTGTPYVELSARVYNGSLVAGVVRVPQGGSLHMKVCNDLPMIGLPEKPISDSPKQLVREATDKGRDPNYLGPNGFADLNVLSHHWHGHYGNPGTSNPKACDFTSPDSRGCWRGDNIFASILPGQCNDYQYDVTNAHSPGLYWMHPHHHGATAITVAFASLPVIVEPSETGFKYLDTDSCATLKPFIQGAPEIILHMQAVLAATNEEGAPADDGYSGITEEFDVAAIPASPATPGSPSAVAAAPMEPGYPLTTSGANANFVVINGVYNPTIKMEAGKIYRIRATMAIVMKWMDLSLDTEGCVMGIYARDGNMLRAVPRMTDHVMIAAANRVELLISCKAGTYNLRTGAGPMFQPEACTSTHCELLQADNLATLNVTGDMGTEYDLLANKDTANSCAPQFPPYLADHREATNARTSQVLLTGSGVSTSDSSAPAAATNAPQMVLSREVVNFTNPDPAEVQPADICGVNGKFWMQNGYVFTEFIGELTSWELLNVNLHPHHHHLQPFQIVNITGDATDPGTWQVGDYTDTLLLPDLVGSAEVRWVPGPYEVTGNGQGVLHCHFLPHADEGCMAMINIANASVAHGTTTRKLLGGWL